MKKPNRLVLLAPLVVVILYSAALGDALRRHRNEEVRIHAQIELQDALQRVLQNGRDAQLGARGYLLTGEDRFLAPYALAVRSLEADLETLRRAASVTDSKRVAHTTTLLHALHAEMAQAIATYRAEGRDAASAVVREGSGRALMQQLRDIGSAWTKEQRGLMRGHETALARRTRLLTLLMAVGGAITLASVFGTGYWLAHEERRSQRARARLATAATRIDQQKTRIAHSEEALQQSEAQLRQAQKMEAVGQLAGGVAHDFNNLLTAIKGTAQIALGDLTDGQQSTRADLIEIDRAADRAADLTRQLLAFSRKQVMHPEVIDVNDTLMHLTRMLERLIGDDIHLVSRFGDATAILVDRGQLEQCVTNLVVNARDAISDGGTITIETSTVEFDDEYADNQFEITPGTYTLISVADTGVGMDDTTLTQVFEPFYTTKPVGHGTGLGLSTVYGIVRQSGGAVHVYSEPGAGSVFRLYFPVTGEAAAAARQADVAPATLEGSETILLAEDDNAVRAIITRILERRGYTVLAANGSAQALHVAAQHRGPIDLLLTDVVMPEMNGPRLVEKVRAIRPDIAVLLMSGYVRGESAVQDLLDSDLPFIDKPFGGAALAGRVRQVLDALPAAGHE